MTNIAKLGGRGIIGAAGDDRHIFLQGLISNDIALCKPGQPIYAALLTPQGKFLHDLFIIDKGDSFLIDCESARAEDLLKRLNMHKLRAKVVLSNLADEYEVWAAWGGNPPSAEWFADPRLPAMGWRAVLKKGVVKAMADFEAYDRHRLTFGVPDGSRDMLIEKSTLLECNMDRFNAISWTKGCYMGQELTARMHHRGLVKKRLYPVTIEGTAQASETVIYLNDKDVGEMRSSCGDKGLALLSIAEAETAGSVYRCGDSKLRVSLPV